MEKPVVPGSSGLEALPDPESLTAQEELDYELGRPSSIFELVGRLTGGRRTQDRITACREFPPQEGRFHPLPADLHPQLGAALDRRGISRLYSHQFQAWEVVKSHHNLVVVTPTASGKTLCYNLPVLDAVLRDPGTRALYIFPTKALSQDQVAELESLNRALGQGDENSRGALATYTYDGDTPQAVRQAIRTRGQIVVTNPDMLHVGILPHHTRWAQFFTNLSFVILDELHAYRGVFGSHLANVIRRLRRVCRFYGSDPVFICSSATIANPAELAQTLLEAEVDLVSESGAPLGRKFFLFYNPPVINQELGIRASALSHARHLARLFLGAGRRTIVFATSRQGVEVLTRYLKDAFETAPDRVGMIRGYRGGYLPQARREIEAGLRAGVVKGVVSTNALELGIDIGDLEVCIMAGYPGTVASTWQQAGRAGRRSGDSVAVLVAGSRPLDQFMVNHPDYFFGRSPEHGRVNPDNLLILLEHLKCAAFELPFSDGESFGKESLVELMRFLEEDGIVHHSGGRWHWTQDAYPADGVGLRTLSAGNFVVADTSRNGEIIAEVDYHAAPLTLYPGAIYLLESRTYQVEKLDFPGRKAYVAPVESAYYTEAIDYTKVRILDAFEAAPPGPARVEHGEVHVVSHVAGFKKLKFYTVENVGYGEVNLPDSEMHTTAYWFTLPSDLLESLGLPRTRAVDGMLGVAYALQNLASLLLMCEVHDLDRCVGDRSAEWHVQHTRAGRGVYSSAAPEGTTADLALEALDRFEPTIFLYDRYPGGMGFSPLLFDQHQTLLGRTHELISQCPCPSGCPSCVGPVNEVSPECKGTALTILDALLGR